MAVPPLEGCRLIRIGLSHLYKLMREGKVKSVILGRRRLILVSSLKQLLGE
jgi:hypothetical protein